MSSKCWLWFKEAFIADSKSVTKYPTVFNHSLDPILVREAARVQRLAELGTREVKEITVDILLNPEKLIPALRNSLENGCLLWVLTLKEEKVRTNLAELFPNIIKNLSHTDPEPIGIQTAALARIILKKHPEVADYFTGIDCKRIPKDILHTLDSLNISVTHHSIFIRALKNPRTLVYLIIFIYSALRALPIVFVEAFKGSVFILWSLDVITAIPYTWGVLAMVLSPKGWIRFLGGIVTMITFLAPYIYFFAHGHDYPISVIIIIALLILLGVATEIFKFRQEQTLIRHYTLIEHSNKRKPITSLVSSA